MAYQCEALVKTTTNRYVSCREEGTDLHHKLPRSRGGKVLDKCGEDYHLIHLCRAHHSWAHANPTGAMAGGLTIDGSVMTENGSIVYYGTDIYLSEKYPH